VRQIGRDEQDVADAQMVGRAAGHLAVGKRAARRDRSASFHDVPHVDRLGVDQRRGLRLLDPPDVDVELAALDHAERLFMGGIHVFEVLIELRLRKRDRTLGRRLLEDVGAAARAGTSGAAPPATLSCRLAALRCAADAHGHSQRHCDGAHDRVASDGG
jgi:hypothetical protein